MNQISWKKEDEQGAEQKSWAQALAKLSGARHAADSVHTTSLTVAENQTQTLSFSFIEGTISIIEITQKPHSKLSLIVSDEGLKESASLILLLRLEDGASAEMFSSILSDAPLNYIQEVHLVGAHSTLNQKTIYFGAAKNLEMFSETVMTGVETKAKITAKGILAGSATVRFDGNIDITTSARGAEARLDEHTLLLSPTAKINAIPALHIGTNEVRAGHAAGITRIDDEQLFYAQSRGIDEATCVKAIAQGFLASLYQDRDGAESEKLSDIIEKKLCQI